MRRGDLIKAAVFIIVMSLLWMEYFPAINSVTQNLSGIRDENSIVVTFHSENYSIIKKADDGYDIIYMENFDNLLIPGNPVLPYKTFLVGLPPGAEVTSVDVIYAEYENISGKYNIENAPFAAGEDGTVISGSNNISGDLSKNHPYPGSSYEYMGTGQMRKYFFAAVRYYPFSYFDGNLTICSRLSLSIGFKIVKNPSRQLMDDTVMDGEASKMLCNYNDISKFYRVSGVSHEGENDNYDYVIITTDGLEDSVSSLVKWKECLGHSVKVVTTSWISDCYDGRDVQEKIRNFLVDKYAEWGIKYVLIVGSQSSVPMRYCYPKSSDETPTDYYYADLTGNWDSDGDGLFGEYQQDMIDLYPEVYVGRIPSDDNSVIQKICEKTVDYEASADDWKYSAMLLGAMSNYANEQPGYKKTDGASLMEYIKSYILSPGGYDYISMYEKEGINPSLYPCDYPITHENVISRLPDGYGLLTWWAHGGPTSAARKTWITDDGDGIPEDSEMRWENFIDSYDVEGLNDEKPSVVFSCSCLNAYPEESNNLGKSLIENGAVAFVGATRVSWYTVGWGNPSDGGNAAIDYYFFYNLVKQNLGCGDALYHSKVTYLNKFFWWGSESLQNMYDFCLYGDPSLEVKLSNYPPQVPSNPYPENDSVNVAVNSTLRWQSGDPEGGELYYDIYLGKKSELGRDDLLESNVSYNVINVTLEANTHYFWRVTVRDEQGLRREGPVWEFYTIDMEMPTVRIDEPKEGYLYIRGQEKRATLLGGTVIIGRETIQVIAGDNLAMEKVEFYIDNQLKNTITGNFSRYSWNWNELSFGEHTIKIVAYDRAGNAASDELKVWTFIFSI